MRVPILDEERKWHCPLPESTAEPYDLKNNQRVLISQRKWGQQLTGDMIPQRYRSLQLESCRVFAGIRLSHLIITVFFLETERSVCKKSSGRIAKLVFRLRTHLYYHIFLQELMSPMVRVTPALRNSSSMLCD